MFKNQLQELAQRSCFNLPSYACIREGPDHAPRFKASVNFNGEIFESPAYSNTLRQAEHAAAEVALNSLSARGPSKSLTARVLDETGVYKNLLQETAHRAGLKLPSYTTVRSGTGHAPIFTSTVEIADGLKFTGESAKTKKQAEKNAAISAWLQLKNNKMVSLSEQQQQRKDHQEHVNVRQALWSSRVIRTRDHHHQRPPHRDRDRSDTIKTKFSSSSSSSSQQKQWKFLDPSKEEGSLFGQKQNNGSFLALLPPPPPRTMSKIFPPPLKLFEKGGLVVPPTPQMKVQKEVSPIIKVGDDHEWIDSIISGIEKRPYNNNQVVVMDDSNSNFDEGKAATCNVGEYNFIRMPAFKFSHSSSTCDGGGVVGQMGRSTSSVSGAYDYNVSQRMIAPAVQIRSVIPVCSAPPLISQRPLNPNSIPSQRPSSSSSLNHPKSIQEAAMSSQPSSSSATEQLAATMSSKLNL